MIKRKTMGEVLFTVFSYVIMTIFSLSILLPILYIVQLTLSDSPDPSFRLFPKSFSFQNYAFVFSRNFIQRPFMNSVFVTVASTAYSMLMSTVLAYPLSMRGLLWRRGINFIVMLPMVISLGFMPSYLLIRDLGLMNSYAALILPSGISTFNLIILRNFFSGLPDSLFESARIDGASEFYILRKIALPLSTAAIASVSLFYLVSSWNDYFNVVLYISDVNKRTLQVVLRMFIFANQISTEIGLSGDASLGTNILNIQYTTIIIAVLPVMAVYPFLQKYFVKGVMLGSIKG